MKEISIWGENHFDTYTKTREASRAVIIQAGNVLLSHDVKTEVWMLPGGGIEAGETPEACCAREIEEETGYIIVSMRKFLVMNEYYEEYRFISHCFACEARAGGRLQLTEAERQRGLQAEWLPVEKAVDMFSRHQEYAAVSEEKRGIYQREHQILLTCLQEG